MKKICRNCKFWTKSKYDIKPNEPLVGSCEGDVFVYVGNGVPEDTNTTQVQYTDRESYDAIVETGADFGCNHWEKKNA